MPKGNKYAKGSVPTRTSEWSFVLNMDATFSEDYTLNLHPTRNIPIDSPCVPTPI